MVFFNLWIITANIIARVNNNTMRSTRYKLKVS